MSRRSDFFIRRFHSLLGLVPIGIFLIVHLLLNSTALAGWGAYEITIGGMKGIPFIIVAELLIIALPILFHAIYGAYVVYVAKNNALRYTYLRNWFFYLQRITAIVTFVFLIYHVLTLRILNHAPGDVIYTLASTLQNPIAFFLYCVGVVSAIFHFANGLFTFLITWGVLQGPKVQTLFNWITIGIFVVMSVWAVTILAHIAGFSV